MSGRVCLKKPACPSIIKFIFDCGYELEARTILQFTNARTSWRMSGSGCEVGDIRAAAS